MKIKDTLGFGGSFTEYYAADFREDVVLLGRGLSVEMSVQHAPVTLLSVIEGANGRPEFVVAEGESVSGPILQIRNTNSRYKFPIGARGFMEQWNSHGPALLGIEMQTVC
jgi:L-arabinose isomerase